MAKVSKAVQADPHAMKCCDKGCDPVKVEKLKAAGFSFANLAALFAVVVADGPLIVKVVDDIYAALIGNTPPAPVTP